jgi:hypothetical protein
MNMARSRPTILFCADPLHKDRVDTSFAGEAAAVVRAGISVGLVDFEALLGGEADAAVRRVDREAERTALYRGWMLPAAQYARLYAALGERSVQLVNDPAAYARCHLLPGWYPLLEGHTPASVWLPLALAGPAARTGAALPIPFEQVHALLRRFGDWPVVLKDYVKSRKHEWVEACFIPSAADADAVERVVRRFVELQGPELTGGLVFREFMVLEGAGRHPRSGAPLAREFRLFFFDAEPVLVAPNWSMVEAHAADVASVAPAAPATSGVPAPEAPPAASPVPPVPVQAFRALAQRVHSRFFTMDVAQRRDGGWTIIELGDGQVAGLPEHVAADAFYAALARAFDRAGNTGGGGLSPGREASPHEGRPC